MPLHKYSETIHLLVIKNSHKVFVNTVCFKKFTLEIKIYLQE